MYRTSRGFTIVELLIVIVVIGILAAIVIVAFSGIQNRAHDTSLRSDLAAVAKKMESYKILSTDDKYPSTLDATGLDLKLSKNAYGNHYVTSNGDHNFLYCMDNVTNRSAYAIVARSKSGAVYTIKNREAPRLTTAALAASATSCADADIGMSSTSAWWGLFQSTWRIAV